MTTTEPSAGGNPAALFPVAGGSGTGAEPAPTAGPGPRGGATLLPGKVVQILESPLLWVLWGLAMAAMGLRVPEWTWPPGAARLAGLAACAVAAAILVRPHTGRPVIDSARWHNVLILHRNTLLSAGFVVLVATEPPQVWEVGRASCRERVYHPV